MIYKIDNVSFVCYIYLIESGIFCLPILNGSRNSTLMATACKLYGQANVNLIKLLKYALKLTIQAANKVTPLKSTASFSIRSADKIQLTDIRTLAT